MAGWMLCIAGYSLYTTPRSLCMEDTVARPLEFRFSIGIRLSTVGRLTRCQSRPRLGANVTPKIGLRVTNAWTSVSVALCAFSVGLITLIVVVRVV
jgi:hypothetical protein